MSSPQDIPAAAWKRHFDEEPLLPAHPGNIDFKGFFKMMPTVSRIVQYQRREARQGRMPIIDISQRGELGDEAGLPLGGLGGGTITRGYRGSFNRWQMQPGIVRYGTVLADQFSLWAQRPAETAGAIVLNPIKPDETELSAWKWDLPLEKGTYYALFPRAWSVYEDPLPGLRLTCRQVSPVIPHNYQEASYPAGVFCWTIQNTGTTPVSTALMFTFQNGDGTEDDLAGGHSNHLFQERVSTGDITGVALRHLHRQIRPFSGKGKGQTPEFFEDPLTFAIAAQATPGAEVSYRTRFVTNTSGQDVWDDFAFNGNLGAVENEKPSQAGLAIGAALAVKLEIPPGESRTVLFSLAWDMPVARFGLGTGWYRRYTRFFGKDGEAAAKLAIEALLSYRLWEEKIITWQQPVLDRLDLPDWYKAMLFNETYYLVDGGTIWTDGKESDAPGMQDALPEPEIGHFAYLESYEYRMYNTYDVHFSASFALATLWPELERSVQQDFIHAVDVNDPEQITLWATGKKAPRKKSGMLPHDLGSPVASPWQQINAYLFQDVSRWKDLNSKFVLQVYRDYLVNKDRSFLEGAWPALQQSVATLAKFDRDGDGMIENDRLPDQTYDTWTATGPSAYTGGLWLACLSAMGAIAQILGFNHEADDYKNRLERAKSVYEAQLWNGSYYNYDCSKGKRRTIIMADQLAGQWFCKACGLPDILPEGHAGSALRQIYTNNVQKFQEGECGAVNGMFPDGKLDGSNLQSREMWIGTNFSLAACMLQEGMKEEAFETAKGVYLAIYRDYGLFFQTPESIDDRGGYRAYGYMRPLAIWALQWEQEKRKYG